MSSYIEVPDIQETYELGEDGRPAFSGFEETTRYIFNKVKWDLLMEARALGCDWAQD